MRYGYFDEAKKEYMLIFNFNKNGKAGIREVTHDNKNLTEAMA